jgi:hypothetical protein
MEDLDLNIDNYSLEDLLSLFHLSSDFSEYDMKQAKKMVLMTHPDKSGLNQEVFFFFSKAYKYLYYIYEFRERNKDDKREDLDNDNEDIISKIKDTKNFQKLFNELFEENKMRDNYSETGYEEWLKSDDNIEITNKVNSIGDMRQAFYAEKKKKQELIKYTGVQDIEDNSHFQLGREAPENFSSSLFSKLQFEDLKKAHTENIIPVSEEDYDPAKHFQNVTQLQSFREQQSTDPLDTSQAKRYLENKAKLESKENTHRAFILAKQMEEAKKVNENILSKFKYLQ